MTPAIGAMALMGLAIAALVVYVIRQKMDKQPTDTTETTTTVVPKAGAKAAIVQKAEALQLDVQTLLAGVGIKVENVKGDFDASAALFFNRALSHGVTSIVRDEDKDRAAQLYAEAALLIAQSGTPASVKE